jgi:hypothetical protein
VDHLISLELPFELETELERRIAANPEWREGIEWGAVRAGHPEGAVKHHVAHVLANVEREATSRESVVVCDLLRSSTTRSSTARRSAPRASAA